MANLEKRVLYSLLRMHWLNDRSMPVEPWQVEDYSTWSVDALFKALSRFFIQLDRTSFVVYADLCDSPEDLTSYLLGDRPVRTEEEDQVYLPIFELWRQLMPNKPSLSIFCSDLDQLIYLYDQGKLENSSVLPDALVKLLFILNENVDAGIEPKEAFNRISAYCANDLEAFLYDFILDQINGDQESYALELLDGFALYFSDNKWFILLRTKLLNRSNMKSANKILAQIIEDYFEENDLDFNLEYLSFMAESDAPLLFRQAVKETLPLLQTEEDFQDILSICIDYYHRLDQDQSEQSVRAILDHRSHLPSDQALNKHDRDIEKLIAIVAI